MGDISILLVDDSPTASVWAGVLRRQCGECHHARSGHEAVALFKESPNQRVLLDLDVRGCSGAEVFQSLKCAYPCADIIMLVDNQERLNSLGLSREDFIRLGARDVLFKPLSQQRLKSLFESGQQESEAAPVDEVAKARAIHPYGDEVFTAIPIHTLGAGAVTSFDIFIRLGQERFLKLIRKGDTVEPSQIKRLDVLKGVKELYIKTSDRLSFIQDLNRFVAKIVVHPSYEASVKAAAVSRLADLLISDVHTTGLSPQDVAECKTLTQSMYEVLRNERTVKGIMRGLEQGGTEQFGHAFLTAFYSGLIARRLKWTTSHSIEKVLFGAFLHDVGRSKELNHSLDHGHPERGVQLLDTAGYQNESVKQIVLQHHERMDGSGFPQHLKGSHIFPLARVVAFAANIAEYLGSSKQNLKSGLNAFLSEEDNRTYYDREIIALFCQAVGEV